MILGFEVWYLFGRLRWMKASQIGDSVLRLTIEKDALTKTNIQVLNEIQKTSIFVIFVSSCVWIVLNSPKCVSHNDGTILIIDYILIITEWFKYSWSQIVPITYPNQISICWWITTLELGEILFNLYLYLFNYYSRIESYNTSMLRWHYLVQTRCRTSLVSHTTKTISHWISCLKRV